jgi:hypothetical protein
MAHQWWHKNQHLIDDAKEPFFTRRYSADNRYKLQEHDFHWPWHKWVNVMGSCKEFGSIEAEVVKLGWCSERHTLKEGDEVDVHEGSGFALMHDHRRWSWELLGPEPEPQIYLCRVTDFLYHGDDEYSYCVECVDQGECNARCSPSRMYTIYPGDVVINVRYRRRHNAA